MDPADDVLGGFTVLKDIGESTGFFGHDGRTPENLDMTVSTDLRRYESHVIRSAEE